MEPLHTSSERAPTRCHPGCSSCRRRWTATVSPLDRRSETTTKIAYASKALVEETKQAIPTLRVPIGSAHTAIDVPQGDPIAQRLTPPASVPRCWKTHTTGTLCVSSPFSKPNGSNATVGVFKLWVLNRSAEDRFFMLSQKTKCPGYVLVLGGARNLYRGIKTNRLHSPQSDSSVLTRMLLEKISRSRCCTPCTTPNPSW